MISVVIAMSGSGCANSVDQLRIFLRGVSAVHRFENSIRARLQWQMHMLGEFRKPRECVDQVIAETDRVRRGKPKRFKPVDSCTASSNCTKGSCPSTAQREFVAAIEIHDLAEEVTSLTPRRRARELRRRFRRWCGCARHRASAARCKRCSACCSLA